MNKAPDVSNAQETVNDVTSGSGRLRLKLRFRLIAVGGSGLQQGVGLESQMQHHWIDKNEWLEYT